MSRPVFYDPTGRRRRRFALAVGAFALLLTLAAGLLAATLTTVDPARPISLRHDAPEPLALRLASDLYKRGKWMIRGHASKPKENIAAAFYVPWDDTSTASLAAHVEELDWVVPGWMSVIGADHQLRIDPDVRGRAILAAARHRPKLLPMLQNADGGDWQGAEAAALLRSPAARHHLLDQVETYLTQVGADGLFLDIESIPASAQPDYLRFLSEVRARFAPHGWMIAVAVPALDDDWKLAAYAARADRVFLMLYDEHWPTGAPGPIASQPWFLKTLAADLKLVPPGKVAVGIGSYAYDWPQNGTAHALAIDEAMQSAHDSSTRPVFERASGNPGFSYEEAGVAHQVWMLDAATAANQMRAARALGVNSFGLWRLGAEDPSIWRIFGRGHHQDEDPRAIETIPAGSSVDIQGSGELIEISSQPTAGQRRVTVDAQGLITDERFDQLPLPYAIRRDGFRPGLVALTFDDGPDPAWTPGILDILKSRHVPATFFVVGSSALGQRNLLRREIAEGHEIGNHSYTHPNLGGAGPVQTELELNATQRLVQAYTGHSLRLFRAPFFGDAEPTTSDELGPVTAAQQLGYLNVGLHVDPDDWRRPGVQAIVDRTVAGVLRGNEARSGNIILLHDSGGDRSQTLAALPLIIDALRARGYRFVPVSELAGMSAAQVMPLLSPRQQLVAKADFAVFQAIEGASGTLGILFGIAIVLGIGRAILLSGLALRAARREAVTAPPPIAAGRFVSVLIPCFNEAKVIEASVRRVLESRAVEIEVIVIDDGSSDGTGDVVDHAFADDARVRLLRLPNGGKARALNRALAIARGEFIVALDADTQFERKTIARLVRWFDDPTIGAVAGNARVGNRVNLVTRWQALEYITAQNLERRALGALGAITVVPGAVGAWRAVTLAQAGGYPPDTLAEDQDLTIRVQRLGWRVTYDQTAIAWTEAPQSFAALAKQRFRWAYGTVQCLWKHRGLMRAGTPRGLAWIGLPQTLLFQLGFAVLSPLIDLALIASLIATAVHVAEHGWAAEQGDLARTGAYWLCFVTIDLLAGVIALALEKRSDWRLILLLLPQRFGYRQIMYWVVLKAVVQAARGSWIGWGKLERSGFVLGDTPTPA